MSDWMRGALTVALAAALVLTALVLGLALDFARASVWKVVLFP